MRYVTVVFPPPPSYMVMGCSTRAARKNGVMLLVVPFITGSILERRNKKRVTLSVFVISKQQSNK
jgi:hypothetical protein